MSEMIWKSLGIGHASRLSGSDAFGDGINVEIDVLRSTINEEGYTPDARS